MTPSTTKILLIEDNPGDARLLREALKEIAEVQFEFIHRESLAEALEFVAESRPDICLLDLGLPDALGLEAVHHLHREAPNVPIVVLTALNDESVAVQALHEGAQDYLIKAKIDRHSLWRALRYAMERQRVQLEVLDLSLRDDLTGLYNRRGFLILAEHHARLAYRTRTPFLVAFTDLDGMKQINDTFGHQEGNRALVEAADVLRDSFRHSDILARLGGDEFAALMAEAGEDSIGVVIQRVEQKLAACNAMLGRRYDLSFSIGIVAGDANRLSDIEQLLSEADARMYQNKNSKKASRKLPESSR